MAVDVGLAHLDRPFDYLVPPEARDLAVPGVRVRVRFAGQRVTGFVLERVATSDHVGALTTLTLVSPEPVLSGPVAGLARAVADRLAGTLADVLRLAAPPRHARVEAQPVPFGPLPPPPPAPPAGTWSRYAAGPAYLTALARGDSPRAVWAALPGDTWPGEIAAAVAAALASGRGALVVVPDARDVERVDAALREALGESRHVTLSAGLGPAERYRRWLAVRRGRVQAVLGTRAAVFAPVAELGLVVVWDDGDDLHAEPRAPYPNVRDVLVLRAHREGAAALIGGLTRTAEGELLVSSGWAREITAARDVIRRVAPRVEATGDDVQQARDPGARTARLPSLALVTARSALTDGAPVLVQVPRRGYQPALACTRCREPARCTTCAGPLGRSGSATVLACRWCGRPAVGWECLVCGAGEVRAVVVGARRTAEELGRAFPGVTMRTSGRDAVLAEVPAEPALVVATPGAEPMAIGGYGAVLLLDGWALLTRPDLRAAEETLRRWVAAAALARPGADGGRVVVVADSGVPAVQALVRWDPTGAASREAAERAEVGFPPAVRMALVSGEPAGVAELVAGLCLPGSTDVLGPVQEPDGAERVLLRVPRADGLALAAALKVGVATRSARKATDAVRVELDPASPV